MSLGSMDASGVVVSPDTALGIAAAYAAINAISTDCTIPTFNVVRERKSGGFDIATDHPVNMMLALKASSIHNSKRLRRATMGHVQGWGNGYLRIDRDQRTGMPLELHPLAPQWDETKPFRNKFGKLLYRVDAGMSKPLPASDVLHIAGLGYDGLVGYSPIGMCRRAFGNAIASDVQAGAYFGNGNQLGGILKIKRELTPTARENLRESFGGRHGGPYNAHTLAILEEDMEYEPTSINPVDAQFIESRGFNVLEIGRIYRCPPHKIGDYSQAHLANLEESNFDYLITSLFPWLQVWEEECDVKLLTTQEYMAGYRCQHDMTQFLRANSTARSDFYTKMLLAGSMSPNDISAREGLPSTEGGDVRILPLNMTTVLEMYRNSQPKAAATAPGEPKPMADLPGTSEPVNVAATALNVAQIASLLDIVAQVSAGGIPAEAAKAIVAASFPTLTPADIEDIFGPLENFKPQAPAVAPLANGAPH
jgi:HK97 family phage portal protein